MTNPPTDFCLSGHPLTDLDEFRAGTDPIKDWLHEQTKEPIFHMGNCPACCTTLSWPVTDPSRPQCFAEYELGLATKRLLDDILGQVRVRQLDRGLS